MEKSSEIIYQRAWMVDTLDVSDVFVVYGKHKFAAVEARKKCKEMGIKYYGIVPLEKVDIKSILQKQIVKLVDTHYGFENIIDLADLYTKHQRPSITVRWGI